VTIARSHTPPGRCSDAKTDNDELLARYFFPCVTVDQTHEFTLPPKREKSVPRKWYDLIRFCARAFVAQI